MTLTERIAAARQGAAVGPVLRRGIMRVTGRDRLSFLHRMSTQTIAPLEPGQSSYAAFLSAKGHLVGEGMVLVREEEILVDLDPAALAETGSHLNRYIVMDRVTLDDASDAWRVLPVLGPRGVAMVRGAAAPRVEGGRRGAPGVDLYLDPAEAAGEREALIDKGAVVLEESDLEVLRIEAGIPRFGVDMDATRLPMEAGLTRDAIHFGKGCYIGQEVVLRATVRGHIQKGLVQLRLPSTVDRGAALRSGEQVVGQVTSAIDTPSGRLGLGYVRRAFWQGGMRLATEGGEAEVSRVIAQEGAG
jgi:tRNA-modifying protein YgfZ